MYVESLMFAGWAAMPVVGFTASSLMIRRANRQAAERPRITHADRLAELRRRSAERGVTRGRKAEAIRLAEAPMADALSLRRG